MTTFTRFKTGILTIFCLLTLGLVHGQVLPDEVEVDIEFVEVTLDQALLLLSKQSNINISFDPDILPAEKRVTFSNRLKLGLILYDILYETDLDYRIVGNQLIIIRDSKMKVAESVTVSGMIQDQRSGENLVYATIMNQDANASDIANEYGYYNIILPTGEQIISYSYVGYERVTIGINLTKDTTINILLRPNNQINEIVVTGSVPEKVRQVEQFDDLPIELMNGMSSLAGEPDLFRMAQMRSGVTGGADGFGGLNIRGGSQDQNLVLMDGVPIYNSGHALGLFSVFNPSMVKSAKLIKGAFPARYGGRLSSVFDVRTREGNRNKLGADFSVSPLLVRAMFEGPLKKEKSSFIVSARRTIVDPWLKPLSQYQLELNNEEGFVNFFFYDLNAKLNFQLGPRDDIYISGYSGKDKFNNDVASILPPVNAGDTEVEELNTNSWTWGNDIATTRWTHIFGQRLFSNLSLSYSRFQFENFEFDRTRFDPLGENEITGFNARLFVSDIQDVIATLEFDHQVTNWLNLRYGANHTIHQLRPGVNFSGVGDATLNDDNRISSSDIRSKFQFPEIDGSETRAYIEGELQIGRTLTMNIGGHLSNISTATSTYQSIQPRLAAKLNFSRKASLKVGYSELDQYLHLLSTSGAGLPNDVWIPSTDRIRPQTSKQTSATFRSVIGSSASISFGGYHKRLENLRALSSGGIFFILEDVPWDEEIPVGTGEAYGAELDFEKRVGRFKGWLNYTYSKSTRTFANLNNGATFDDRNDRRHSVNLSSYYRVNDNIELNAGWTISSGSPITLPTTFTQILVDNRFELIPIYDRINNGRLPTYHKLDFSVNIYTDYNWGRQKLSFGAYNTYNRANPFYIDIVRDRSNLNRLSAEQVSLLPLIPFVSISISL